MCVYSISQKHIYIKNAKHDFAIEIFNIVIEMFNSFDERRIRKVEKVGLVTNLLYLLVTGFEKLNKQAKQLTKVQIVDFLFLINLIKARVNYERDIYITHVYIRMRVEYVYMYFTKKRRY